MGPRIEGCFHDKTARELGYWHQLIVRADKQRISTPSISHLPSEKVPTSDPELFCGTFLWLYTLLAFVIVSLSFLQCLPSLPSLYIQKYVSHRAGLQELGFEPVGTSLKKIDVAKH